MSIVGQTKLLTLFSEMIQSHRLPQFMILEGMKGQGKKTLAFSFNQYYPIYVLPELKVDSVREMIEDSYTLSSKKVYLVADADTMTVQAQNALLKFCEEPSPNAIIIMTVENIDNVLSTIKSRAKTFKLDSYTREELQNFTQDELLLNVCENPGQIIRGQQTDISKLLKTAETVVENISVISTANAFNIPKHFELEDADLFIQLLLYKYTEKLRGSRNGKTMILNQIRAVMKYKNQLQSKSINKANALEMMFVEMREGVLQ